MAAEVTIVCDECSAVIVAAKTATQARKEGIRDGVMVRRKGEDICRQCNDRRKRKSS